MVGKTALRQMLDSFTYSHLPWFIFNGSTHTDISFAVEKVAQLSTPDITLCLEKLNENKKANQELIKGIQNHPNIRLRLMFENKHLPNDTF